MTSIVSPSLLAADFAHLSEELAVIEKSGAEWLHLDVMDGHFVPNLSFGPPVIAALRPLTKLFFDVHLMITNPADSLDWYLDAGADLVCVHYESEPDLNGVFARIREAGVKSGLALCPDTPVELACPWLDVVDMVLVMGVHPGFAGQEFIARTPDKVAALVELCEERGARPLIQVDGGINAETAALCAAAGASVFVAGNAVFKAADKVAAVDRILQTTKGD